MEMQFEKIPVTYMQKLTGQLLSQEQTLEVRLPDGMPDIGSVLGAWGQVIVRGKEWNGDHMALSCGVMVWVLYIPEEEEGVRSVDAWLPFSMKWDLPESRYDGRILAQCLLKSVDARSTSARKLIIRATVDALGEAWQSAQEQYAAAGERPEDVELLTAQYPVMLPREAGEKAFLMEEQLVIPGPKPEKLLYYCLQPEIVDKKVMSGKVVFRGNGNLHLLYRTEDGGIRVCDWDLPFSQYADLEGSYEQDSAVSVYPCTTSLDLTLDENGDLQLKAGLLGQYLISDRSVICLAEDAYSPHREISPIREQLMLPVILDQTVQELRAEHLAQADVREIVDLTFCPGYGETQRTEDGVRHWIPGYFQMLYYDADGALRSMAAPWEGEWRVPASPEGKVAVHICNTGRPQATTAAGNVTLRGEVLIDSTTVSGNGMSMITELEMGEFIKRDPNRPGLILQRKGSDRLWDVAKNAGTTVEKIMQANGLESEPEDDRILLIPVV